MQLQQRFVDAAQLFGTQVPEVHRQPHAALRGVGQGPHGGEQVHVGDRAALQVRDRPLGEQEAAERGQGKPPATVIVAQPVHHQP